jgi:hypothetical protein
MGLFDLIDDSIDAFNLADGLSEDGASPKMIIMEGLEEALGLMESMIVNPGQGAIYENEIQPAFENATILAIASAPEFNWDEVMTEYPEAVGEMVEEGNNVMIDACNQAEELQEEIEEAIEDRMVAAAAKRGGLAALFLFVVDLFGDINEESEEEDEGGSFF